MLKKTLMTNSKIDLDLFLCTEILKLNSLHFGYWERSEELTFENLKKAQIRFTEKLIELIPEEIETILDVGCGIGDVAVALAEKNYIVTALSPDENHKKYFDRYNHTKISFCQDKFEDFNSALKYDLILMSESQNYFDSDIGFSQIVRYLKKNGYLLVSGIFRKQNSSKFNRTINITGEYLKKAQNNGLTLIHSIDISGNILPNLNYADAVIIGAVEDVWTNLIDDFSKGKLKKIYRSKQQSRLNNIPIPRWDLMNKNRYFVKRSLSATRGCSHRCDFCSISCTHGSGFRMRPIADVVRDIRESGVRRIMLFDDNIIDNRIFARNLFKALIPLKVRWVSQATFQFTEDEELIKLAYKTGRIIMERHMLFLNLKR